MIKAQHHLLYVSFFRFYTKWMIRRHFHCVILKGEFIDLDLPVLLIGNHFGWWDGFIANLLNNYVFKRKIHIMMLEDQLSSRMFLNKAGAYSIKKGSRSIFESLTYTIQLLERKENLVVLYPQGEFESQYRRPVRFEKGIERIMKGAGPRIHLVFYAALADYFSHRKPSLSIYLKEVRLEIAPDARELECAYNEFLEGCVTRQQPA